MNSMIRLVKNQIISTKLIQSNLVRYYTSDVNNSIFTQLKSDLKTSMKAKDRFRSGLIRSLLSDISYAEMAMAPGTKLLQDSELAPLLFKAIERRKDSIEQYKAGNRSDLVETEERELDLIKTYLPLPMTEDEILIEVKKVCDQLGLKSVKDMGKLMAGLQLDATRAPKATVAQVAKKYIQSL